VSSGVQAFNSILKLFDSSYQTSESGHSSSGGSTSHLGQSSHPRSSATGEQETPQESLQQLDSMIENLDMQATYIQYFPICNV